jgi:hypothetical protein
MKISGTIKNIITIVLLSVCTQFLYANENIYCEIQSGSMGYFGSVHDKLYTYSEKWQMGAGIAYNISPYVELNGIVSYHRFAFNYRIDEPGGTSYSLHIDTQPAHLYETSIALRIMTSSESSVHPYLLLRTGFDIIKIGEENYTYSYQRDSTTKTSKISGQKIVNPFVGFGIGLNIPFSDDIKLKTELFYSKGDEANYIGITGAFQFSL